MNAHYRKYSISALDVIREYGFGFCLGNVIKYLLRYRHKPDEVENDIRKAIWYLVYFETENQQLCDSIITQINELLEKENSEVIEKEK